MVSFDFRAGEAFIITKHGAERLDYDEVMDLKVEIEDLAEKVEEHQYARERDEYGDMHRLRRQ